MFHTVTIEWIGEVEYIFPDGFVLIEIPSKKTLFDDLFGTREVAHIRGKPLKDSVFVNNLKLGEKIKITLKNVEAIKADIMRKELFAIYGIVYSFEENGFYLKYDGGFKNLFVELYNAKARITSTTHLNKNPYESTDIVKVIGKKYFL